MTLRTLLLENTLLTFLSALCANLQAPISLQSLLKLLFDRSAVCMETHSEVIYRVDTDGLSAHYKKTLKNLIEGLNKMNLNCRGKPIRVCIRDAYA
ncbi:MAG: hypothetical protein HQK67_00915 [Desulfamplus sp.]|nr:hypothetical protein [Desulfamplus sp.]